MCIDRFPYCIVCFRNDRPEELLREESNHSNRASVPTLSEVCEAKLSSSSNNPESSAYAPSDINEGHVGDTTKCCDTDLVTDTAEVDQLATSLDAITTNSLEESIPVSIVDDVAPVTYPAVVADESAARQTVKDEPESEAKQPTFAEILKQYRKFSIDLMPKVRVMLCSTC